MGKIQISRWSASRGGRALPDDQVSPKEKRTTSSASSRGKEGVRNKSD